MAAPVVTPVSVRLSKKERDAIDAYLAATPDDAAAASAPPPPPPPPAAARRGASAADNGEYARAELARLDAVRGGRGDADRARLPAYAFRDELVSAVDGSRVTVVRGATGCGKSTQLPRLLLEAAVAAGAPAVRIAVCEPRRLAATALARRVCAELSAVWNPTNGFGVSQNSSKIPTAVKSNSFPTILGPFVFAPRVLDD